MSLVNDALKKARMEAARTEAAGRGIPYPILGKGEPQSGSRWIAALAALILVAGVGGLLLYRAGQKAAHLNQATEMARAALPSNPEAPARNSASPPSGSRRPTRDSEAAPGNPIAPLATAQAARPTPAENPGVSPPSPREEAPSAGDRSGSAPPSPVVTEPKGQSPSEDTSQPRASQQPAPAPTPREDLETEPAEAPAPREDQEFVRRADVPGIGPIELSGIAWSGDKPFALVNGRVVRPGDAVSGLIVDEIKPNTIRLRSDQGTLTLRLK